MERFFVRPYTLYIGGRGLGWEAYPNGPRPQDATVLRSLVGAKGFHVGRAEDVDTLN